MVKHILTALTIFTPFVPTQQVHDDFDTFAPASVFNDAFGDLDGYLISQMDLVESEFQISYTGDLPIYFVYPTYYDFIFTSGSITLYYSNDLYNFYVTEYNGIIALEFLNYIGSETEFSFGSLNSEAMTTYKNNEKGQDVVSDIIGNITSMVTGLLGGIGTGVVGIFSSLFMDGSNISSLGIFVIVLLGLSIALGAVAWVSTLIRGKQR